MAGMRSPQLEQALLEAVCEAPEDDAPRLVYADWLMEQLEAVRMARGEFIRLECELVRQRLKGEGTSQRLVRATELWNRHRGEGGATLPRGVRDLDYWRRGFPEDVSISALNLLKSADRLFRTIPIVRLEARSADGHVPDVLALPHLARLWRLTLLSKNADEDVARVAACAGLAGLKWLSLFGGLISEAGALALAASPALGQLERLDLRCPLTSGPGLAALRGRFGGLLRCFG